MIEKHRQYLTAQQQQRFLEQQPATGAAASSQPRRRRGPQQQQVEAVTMETAASSMDALVTSGQTGLGLTVAKFVLRWAPAQRKCVPAERDPTWAKLFGAEQQ